MKPLLTVRQASAAYPVWAGRGLLGRVGDLASPRGRAFVVTGASIPGGYAEAAAASFSPKAEVIAIADGELNKTLESASAIVSKLLELGARRDATVVAVGGGMIGDTAGFAAAIFMRGVDLVQVPTTLLAQVDSSIGGKVGVNHPAGKNLIGAFHPPRAVVTDPDVLATLPQRDLVSGMFEALKGGVIGDPALFDLFESGTAALLARDADALDEVIRRKIAVKAGIVAADERESGQRRLLNYGHTIGHGIEAALSYEGLTHGEAVGWGMLAANAIAVRRGLLSADDAALLDRTIRGLPLPRFTASREAILGATAHDKKNRQDALVMVLPRRVGECVVVEDVAPAEVELGVDAILG